MSFYSEITELILSKKIQSKVELHKTKIKLCKKYKIDNVPPDSEILARLPNDFSDEEMDFMISVLRKKSMRTISGVAIIAVMTSPEECPHGLCIPCPGGPSSNTPQSYTGYEPAAMRAILNDFDPYLQTKSRMDQLKAIGHSVDKIDFILMGGTFTSRTPYYQEWFVKRCFDALNDSESNSLEVANADILLPYLGASSYITAIIHTPYIISKFTSFGYSGFFTVIVSCNLTRYSFTLILSVGSSLVAPISVWKSYNSFIRSFE